MLLVTTSPIFAARVASSSKARSGSKRACDTALPSLTCGQPSPEDPKPDCVGKNGWSSSTNLQDSMRHHILWFSQWEPACIPVEIVQGLNHPKYIRVEPVSDAGHGYCRVKAFTFVGGDVVDESRLHWFLPPKPCTCGGATAPTAFLAFAFLSRTDCWKAEEPDVAQHYLNQWSKDFGGVWHLPEVPIRSATKKMACLLNHVRDAVA